jgi:hypothetical protein
MKARMSALCCFLQRRLLNQVLSLAMRIILTEHPALWYPRLVTKA